jgi:hypothetical protein
MKIFQAYVNEQQKKLVDNHSIPLNASWNSGGNEYELFKYIKNNQGNESDSPWGLVSWKFTAKCQLKIGEFVSFSEKYLRNGYDCVFINPMIGNEAIYLNVWEQGKDCGHHGIDKVETFLTTHFDTNITAIMSNETFAFCNYFIATNKFWDQYFRYIEKALSLLQQESQLKSDIGLAYSSSANYQRNTSLSLRPFVIERLFSSFLHTTNLKYANYNHKIDHYHKKFGTLLGNHLFNLSTLKNHAISQKQTTQLNNYLEQRKKILHSNYKCVIWELDDPNNLLF